MADENRDDLIMSVDVNIVLTDCSARPNACLLLMQYPVGVERFLFPLSDAFDGLRDLRLAAMKVEGLARSLEGRGFRFDRQIVHLENDRVTCILGTWHAPGSGEGLYALL